MFHEQVICYLFNMTDNHKAASTHAPVWTTHWCGKGNRKDRHKRWLQGITHAVSTSCVRCNLISIYHWSQFIPWWHFALLRQSCLDGKIIFPASVLQLSLYVQPAARLQELHLTSIHLSWTEAKYNQSKCTTGPHLQRYAQSLFRYNLKYNSHNEFFFLFNKHF